MLEFELKRFPCVAVKGKLNIPNKKDCVEKQRKQKFLVSNLIEHFSPKHYPNIFLDQRLRSMFFE